VEDRVTTGPDRDQAVAVEEIDRNRFGAERPDLTGARVAAGETVHHVTGGDEVGDDRPPEHAGGVGDEYSLHRDSPSDRVKRTDALRAANRRPATACS
jgi:hypothetical protein